MRQLQVDWSWSTRPSYCGKMEHQWWSSKIMWILSILATFLTILSILVTIISILGTILIILSILAIHSIHCSHFSGPLSSLTLVDIVLSHTFQVNYTHISICWGREGKLEIQFHNLRAEISQSESRSFTI